MIIKSHELSKINLTKRPFILFYGKNEGLKNQSKNILLKEKIITGTYDEKEILDNTHDFLESIYSKSFFESEKVIILKRVTDKSLGIISEVINKNLDKIVIIVEASNLEKKSKLRIFFEKEEKCACVPFYPDNEQTLSKIGFDFIRQKKILISSSDLNALINKSNGDRQILNSELEKLEYYSKKGKKITTEILTRLTNLIENHDISELIDYCLVKNQKKIINILTENNFNNEDCILIVRTLLNKLKRILVLSNEFKKNNDLNLTISKAKPPIFWKQKEITKQQILKLKTDEIKNTIYKLNELEIEIKTNFENSVKLITDFLLTQFTLKTSS